MTGARGLATACGVLLVTELGCDSSLSAFTSQALADGGASTVEPPSVGGSDSGVGGSSPPSAPSDGGAQEPGASGRGAAGGTLSAGGTSGSPLLLIDDFEDGDIQADPPVGWWYLVNDGTGTQDIRVEYASGRDDPSQALRTSGSNFSDWGAALGLNLKPKSEAFDASSYGSLRFWARAGQDSSKQVSVEFLDLQHVHYRTRVTLTDGWLLYDLPLANFRSADGTRVLDPGALEALQFFTTTGRAFDLWFDEVLLAP